MPRAFRGNQTDPKPHRVFSVEVSELRGTYTCNFEVLSERKVCGLVPKVNDQNILKELRGKKIHLTDSSCEGAEIDLLIGADVIYGKTVDRKCSHLTFWLNSCLKEWESMNIIESVAGIELNNKCHYLPHRPVIELNSQTTKVRSVFDASQRGKLSLNESLHKGINLLERIPDTRDRFNTHEKTFDP
ncbi:uncharacterized protein TNCV_2956261 [Trichonephila clavipes]|nr:uncharacterized protein TNCV_2956261 [Trichonephila clavipes]